ncbi:TPA: glycosyltransferase [Clostridium perfringens]|nr:glycosyltransferase [Clostridium perfringens]EJT6484007.1 glycosyltransferase [Clostridium perfringens]ELC8434675.1 glycosyltransferase [Clostridium perfringens]MDU4221910.1 glycosyltransferase [Clostridium perfringens]BDA23155.1 hypothetical protein CPBEC1_23650 [Clostridium perfringens]
MKPAVSVIVPIYNVEKYLSKCIESIINQTLTNIEIILVDDGSTDNSGFIADEYEKKDERIKVFHKENGGQGSARNLGLDIANGEYIGFIDSDDWIDLDMYEKLYNNAINNDVSISICNRRVLDENDSIKTVVKIEEKIIENVKNNIINYIIDDLLYKHTVVVYNKLYKTEILKNNKIYFKEVNEVGSEDALFNYQVLFYVDKIGTVNTTYHNQLAREGSTTRKYRVGAMKRTAKFIENIYLYSESIDKYNIGKEIAPVFLIFFQQWNYNFIRNYGNENLFNNMVIEQREAEKNNYFKRAEKSFIFDKNIKQYIKKLGYSSRGKIFMNLYMFLSLIGLYKLSIKARTII